MKKIILKVIDYLKYPSTWKGLVSVLTAFGVAISPEVGEKIVAFGLGAIGFIQIFVDDNTKDV